jgi:hypothetical protein
VQEGAVDFSTIVGVGGLLVGAVSLLFSVRQYYESKRKFSVEQEKLFSLRARLQSAYEIGRSAHENLEMLIARSKDETVTSRELRYLARAVRAPVVATLRSLSSAEQRLRSWKWGVSSEDDPLLDRLTPLQQRDGQPDVADAESGVVTARDDPRA